MKKYTKILIGASILGVILAFFFYRDINKEVKAFTSKEDIIYIFQAGVYKNLDNAKNFTKTIPPSIIVEDDGYFRVYIGVVYSTDAKEKLKTFFDNLHINYYIKEKKVSNSLTQELSNYESALIKQTKNEVIENINKGMLNKLLEYLT